jgi:hypothetical protein
MLTTALVRVPWVGPDREDGEDMAVVVHVDHLAAVIVQRARR